MNEEQRTEHICVIHRGGFLVGGRPLVEVYFTVQYYCSSLPSLKTNIAHVNCELMSQKKKVTDLYL